MGVGGCPGPSPSFFLGVQERHRVPPLLPWRGSVVCPQAPGEAAPSAHEPVAASRWPWPPSGLLPLVRGDAIAGRFPAAQGWGSSLEEASVGSEALLPQNQEQVLSDGDKRRRVRRAVGRGRPGERHPQGGPRPPAAWASELCLQPQRGFDKREAASALCWAILGWTQGPWGSPRGHQLHTFPFGPDFIPGLFWGWE